MKIIVKILIATMVVSGSHAATAASIDWLQLMEGESAHWSEVYIKKYGEQHAGAYPSEEAIDWWILADANKSLGAEGYPVQNALKVASFNEVMRFEDVRHSRVLWLAEKFWNVYPDSAKRFDALRIFLKSQADFENSYPLEPVTTLDFIGAMDNKKLRGIDVRAKSAWLQKGFEMVGNVVMVEPTFSRAQREEAEFLLFARDMRLASAYYQMMYLNRKLPNIEDAERVFWTPFQARFNAHAIRYMDLPVLSARASDYLSAVNYFSPRSAEEGWQNLLKTLSDLRGNKWLVAQAGFEPLYGVVKQQLEILEKKSDFASAMAQNMPLDLRFTALDGREVDLSKMKGRVVLIDFWATWCSGCVQALPYLKALHDKYHDEGFDIIGVTFQGAYGKDPVLKLIEKYELPWSQRVGNEDLSQDELAKIYGVTGLPTTFLLDKEGRLVSRFTGGENLEPLIQKLLNQSRGKSP